MSSSITSTKFIEKTPIKSATIGLIVTSGRELIIIIICIYIYIYSKIKGE